MNLRIEYDIESSSFAKEWGLLAYAKQTVADRRRSAEQCNAPEGDFKFSFVRSFLDVVFQFSLIQFARLVYCSARLALALAFTYGFGFGFGFGCGCAISSALDRDRDTSCAADACSGQIAISRNGRAFRNIVSKRTR